MNRKRVAIAVGVALLVLFLPHILLVLRFDGRIYRQVDQVPVTEYGIIFGAYVTAEGALTDAARERVEAAVLLYERNKIEKLFISGDNRSNRQADEMAAYARKRGIPVEDIVVNRLGIDTQDTCRHLARLAAAGTLLTQGYYLPRAMSLCEQEGIQVQGMAVNHLGILAERGSNFGAIWFTRASRFVREALMTWSFVLGVYDQVSNEAEQQE